MKIINLPRLDNKRRRLFFSLMLCILIPDILFNLLRVVFLPEPNDKLLKGIQQAIQSESQQMQDMSLEINKLKQNYQDLNKQLSQELNFREGLKFTLAAEGGFPMIHKIEEG